MNPVRRNTSVPEGCSCDMCAVCFFFSSRRRHTRCSRDWSSDVCSSDLAGELHRTTVNGGLVNVMLGIKTPLKFDFDQQLYLEITVDVSGPTGQPDNAITAADPPMLPRQVILPVVFAKESALARDSAKLAGHDWTDLLVGGNDPFSGKIRASKIEDQGITAAQIANEAITKEKIAPGSVTSEKISDGALLDRHVSILSKLTTPDGSTTNALQVDPAVNVGIGRTNPVRRVDVEGRIPPRGQEFSKSGTVDNQGIVQVPWGTTDDWNIFVSPRTIGYIEGINEGDNALLYFECFASAHDTTSWQATVRSRFRYANSDSAVGW